MSDSLRLFFAIEVPEDLKTELGRFCESIDRKNWRAVKTGQMHITLAFMGEVSEEDLDKVFAAGEMTAEKFSGFRVELSDTGVFPEIGEPSVLYAKVVADEVVEVAKFLKEQLGDLTDRRKVKAHLTLARRKGARARKEIRKIRGSWFVDSFVLVKSELLDQGANHEVLKRFELKK